jgi:uncharacterized protein YbjT (DUF2867 family)
MKIILLGATGMVGNGVLRECLLDPDVEAVLSIGRKSIQDPSPKLRELLLPDLFQLPNTSEKLDGYGACFFCMGVSSVGMSEADYQRITYDLTLAVANTLVKQNPNMTFTYVSGAGTDSSEQGKLRWARVKGATENALLRLPFKAAYMFRPGYIQPMHGARAKSKWVNLFYAIFGPLYPILKAILPNFGSSTVDIGQAMLRAAKRGAPKSTRWRGSNSWAKAPRTF